MEQMTNSSPKADILTSASHDHKPMLAAVEFSARPRSEELSPLTTIEESFSYNHGLVYSNETSKFSIFEKRVGLHIPTKRILFEGTISELVYQNGFIKEFGADFELIFSAFKEKDRATAFLVWITEIYTSSCRKKYLRTLSGNTIVIVY